MKYTNSHEYEQRSTIRKVSAMYAITKPTYTALVDILFHVSLHIRHQIQL